MQQCGSSETLSESATLNKLNTSTQDGHSSYISQPPSRPANAKSSNIAPSFSSHLSVKDEMKIDLRKLESPAESICSLPYKIYPIEEVTETDSSSKMSEKVKRRHDETMENIARIMEASRIASRCRPTGNRK